MVNLNSPAARPRKFLSLPSLHTLRRHRLKVLHSYFTKVIHEYFERRDSLKNKWHEDPSSLSVFKSFKPTRQNTDDPSSLSDSGGNNIIISGTTDGGTFNFGPSEKKEIAAWSVG
ncbi:unnamed protein product [Rhizophagus irregularis]|nr:unnamed protein product [Rhizophagus irregularis]CAB5377929.1 unnamed protein product [Rhizophagus irregularis]